MNVQDGNYVRIDCELRVSGGEVIESSKKSGPVEYKHGTGQLLAGLETRLAGMGVGDEKSGVIPADEAFGTDGGESSMSIPRAEFPDGIAVEAGARFEAKSPKGTPVTLEVVSVDADTITAKVVHPLAGKDLEFTVKVLSVRPPPPPVPTTEVEDLELTEEPDSQR